MSLGNIQTYTGRALNPLTMTADDVDICDIAHHLSLLCRYNGAVARFYSVAEHCVLLSRAVAPENALWALLHDATEAYVGDMVWPLKNVISEFEVVEDRLMRTIGERYGLAPEQPAEVREYDRRIVVDERDALVRWPNPLAFGALEGKAPLGVEVTGWAPAQAEHEYTLRFNQLVNP